MFVLPCLMAGPLMAQETKVTWLMSKDLKEFSGKEGLMITVENAGDFVVPLSAVEETLSSARSRRPSTEQDVRDMTRRKF